MCLGVFSRLCHLHLCACMWATPVCPDAASCGSGVLDKHVLDSSRATSVSSASGRGFGLSVSSLITDTEIYQTHRREACSLFINQTNITGSQ